MIERTTTFDTLPGRRKERRSTLTRPCLLSGQNETVALRMGVADVGCLSGAVDRQHAALLAVGRPAAVLHIPRGPHTSHHGVI